MRVVWRCWVFIIAMSACLAVNEFPAFAGDSPSGYWWGTDSNGPAPSSSDASCPSSSTPWYEPKVVNGGCGRYGGYVGEVGTFTVMRGCSLSQAWNSTAANRANANANSGIGSMGTIGYWFAGGPGADPSYNGTTSEAYAWGVAQAKKAVALAGSFTFENYIMVMDVEEPGGGFYTGWNETVTGCGSLKSSTACCATAVARATVNGFSDQLYNNTTNWWPALYSSPSQWGGIFGTGSDASITNEMEWTWTHQSGCINPGPHGWTQDAGACSTQSAAFFGGVTQSSNCALMWQWKGGAEDYNQIDWNRRYLCK